MLKPTRQPYGFKNLLAYKKAEELQMECSRITAQFPKYKTLIALADQMDRSARSAKQNIVEGWKRNSTMEYYNFLGFSMGANTELEEDCNDVWNGVYRDLMGVKGVMGEKGSEMGGEKGEKGNEMGGEKGEKGMMVAVGEREVIMGMGKKGTMGVVNGRETVDGDGGMGEMGVMGTVGEMGMGSEMGGEMGMEGERGVVSIPFVPLIPLDIEKISFYPLNKNLPLIIQLKLRCKELNYLLSQLQKSLENKMKEEKTLSAKDLAQNRSQQLRHDQAWGDNFLEQYGFERLENGQVVSKQ